MSTSHTERLTRALCKAIDEHGTNNTFTCGELASLYGGPPSRFQGLMSASVRFDCNGVRHEARRHRSGTPLRTGWAVGPLTDEQVSKNTGKEA